MPRASLHPALSLLILLLASTSVLGCDETVGATLRFDLRAPDGMNPAADPAVDSLHIRVLHEGSAEVSSTRALTERDLDLRISVPDIDKRTRVAFELTGPAGASRIGAPPAFIPSSTTGALRAVLAPPATCAVLSLTSLSTPRARSAFAVFGTFAFIAGGDGLTSATERVEYVDLLSLLSPSDTGVLSAPLGPAKAAALDTRSLLVVSALRGPFLYDLDDRATPELAIALHSGAGPESALLSLGDNGAVVIGGAVGDEGVAGVSFVDPQGNVRSLLLAAPRRAPAAYVFSDRILVLGGAAEDAPFAEWILPEEPIGVPIPSINATSRRGAHLVAEPSGDRILLIGGLDALGAPRADTVLLTGCPAACVSSPGPTWTRPRAGVAAAGALIAGGVGASTDVDVVRFTPGEVLLERAGSLVHGRADASAIAFDTGTVLVLGGADPSGPRRDVEICFPASLALP